MIFYLTCILKYCLLLNDIKKYLTFQYDLILFNIKNYFLGISTGTLKTPFTSVKTYKNTKKNLNTTILKYFLILYNIILFSRNGLRSWEEF